MGDTSFAKLPPQNPYPSLNSTIKANTFGCEAADWAGTSGAIVLLPRGNCSFYEKVCRLQTISSSAEATRRLTTVCLCPCLLARLCLQLTQRLQASSLAMTPTSHRQSRGAAPRVCWSTAVGVPVPVRSQHLSHDHLLFHEHSIPFLLFPTSTRPHQCRHQADGHCKAPDARHHG